MLNEEISEDQQFEIISKYFIEKGPALHQFDSYEYLVDVVLQKLFDECPSIKHESETSKFRASFGQVYVEKASIIDENNVVKNIFPYEARLRNLDYESPVSVDIKEEFWELDEKSGEFEKTNEITHKKILLFKLPTMVRSSRCNLYGLSEEELLEKKEDANCPGGYFIINGNERVLVAQERLNHNHVYVFATNDEKYPYVAEIRSISEETGHSAAVQAKINSELKNTVFSLPYMAKDVSAGAVFKALGFNSEEIVKFILPETKDEFSLVSRMIRESVTYTNKTKAIKYISGATTKADDDELRRVIYTKQVIENELFPHMGMSSNTEKAIFLGDMIHKLYKTALTVHNQKNNLKYSHPRPFDDRDNVSVKRVEGPGVLVSDLLRMCLKRYCDGLKKYIEKRQDILTAINRNNNSITSSIHHCFPAGTLVSLSNGTSIPIERLIDTGSMVLAWDKHGLSSSKQTHFYNQGIKDTIKLTFEDGRTISCTPDHKILVSVNGVPEWIEAGVIPIGSNIISGPDFPEDVIGVDEVGWSFETDYNGIKMVWSMETPEKRAKTLALSRIVGMILTDGYLLGSMVDVNNFIEDYKLITEKIPLVRSQFSDGNNYSIHIRTELTNILNGIQGITVGKKTTQPRKIPKYILDPSCPISVVREFLGGLFGGDGHCPHLDFRESERGCITGVALSWTTSIDELKNIIKLLEKVGVSGGRINNDYRLHLQTGTDFAKKVGFRYCNHKSYKLTIATTYWRMEEEIKKQCLREEYGAKKFFEQMGVLKWFEGDYVCERECQTIPTFLLKLVDIRVDKPQVVYDITVNEKHSFVGNGLVVSNCMATGTWSVQKNSYSRAGVSQVMSRLSYPATLSHLRRVVIPIGKEGKNVKIRQIDPTQVFFIDVVESSWL
jgi:intein/homing endonuclease